MWGFLKLLLYFPFQSKLLVVIQMYQCGQRHGKCVYLAAHLKIWKVTPPFHNSHSSLNQWLPISKYSSSLKKWDKSHLLDLLISIPALASSTSYTYYWVPITKRTHVIYASFLLMVSPSKIRAFTNIPRISQ